MADGREFLGKLAGYRSILAGVADEDVHMTMLLNSRECAIQPLAMGQACASSLYNPNAFRIGSSCIENRIASSVDDALACSCQDQSGTMNVSPFCQ